MVSVRRSNKHVSDAALAAWIKAFTDGTEVSAAGNLSYKRLDFLEMFEILPDAFHVTSELDPSEKAAVLSAAARACRSAGTMTVPALIKAADRLVSDRLKMPKSTFSMWTKLRARQASFSPGFKLQYGGVRIWSASRLPPYMRAREYFLSGHGRIDPTKPTFYGHLVARCSARTDDGAVRTMLHSLQVVMGLTNLVLLYGSWSHPIGRKITEGKLFGGPYYFLYKGRRFLGEERVWYNPQYDEEAWASLTIQMPELLQALPHVRRLICNLEEHTFGIVLARTITLLQEGFESADTSFRLLRYWSALEHLYAERSSRQRNYDRIMKRAAFAEPEFELTLWKLRHASNLRNEYVHLKSHDEDLQAICQFLRDMLSRHLLYLLKNPRRFATHDEFLQFVELPRTVGELTALKALVELRTSVAKKVASA
jgi:hypothetical protein